MQRFLSTPGLEAYFDFLSLIVVLERYDIQHLEVFQKAIAWEPGQPIDVRTAELRALLKHEVTHFLDMTTTEWGAQYIIRKLRMLCKIQKGSEEFSNADEVFALETSAIELHTALLEAGQVAPASCDTIQHDLVYRKEFGVCVLVHYLKDKKICHKVPMSMLSLLEANATASEYLSLIQCAESCEDIVEKRLAIEEVHRRYEALLNDPARLEYSVLLHLTRVHFKSLTLAEQFKMVAALARFSLDSSGLNTGRMVNVIQRSFQNKILGDMLAMELRRRGCLELIFFKTVLFMYGWLYHMEDDKRVEIEVLLRNEPIEAIRRMWAYCIDDDMLEDSEWRQHLSEEQEKWMRELGVPLADAQIFGECNRANRTLLENTSVGVISFKELKLLNALLADETEILFPNCIDINVQTYFNENLEAFSMLDSAYRKMKHERFHLPFNSDLIVRL